MEKNKIYEKNIKIGIVSMIVSMFMFMYLLFKLDDIVFTLPLFVFWLITAYAYIHIGYAAGVKE